MSPTDAAAVLAAARADRRPVAAFTDGDPALDEDWACAVQALDRAARISAGEQVIGAKLGLTSAAKQHRMGVAQPVAGFLTDAMLVRADGLAARHREWIQPRIEPEIAFVLGEAIDAPLRFEDAARVVTGACVAAEIIDSRYADYRFRLPDVVADNTSAAGVVLGEERTLTPDLDLAALRCTLAVDGATLHEATGAAVLEHPLNALVWLSEHLARRRESVAAGAVVLAGALTDAVPLAPGHRYEIRIESLGSIGTSL